MNKQTVRAIYSNKLTIAFFETMLMDILHFWDEDADYEYKHTSILKIEQY